MKQFKPFLITILLSITCKSFSQIGIGTTNPNSSSILDINSNNRGLLIPRLSDNQILNINNPAHGLLVFNTTINNLQINIGTYNYPYWSSLNSNGLNTVSLVPESSGVSGAFIANQPLVDAKITISFINNSFNDVGMELNSSDIELEGINGITISNISDSYPWLMQGDTVSVDYELSGTPLNTGDLICKFKYKGMVFIEAINISN